MPEPVHIAAIDAGSNAVRLSIARAYSGLDIEPLITERYPLRLGEGVFVRHRFIEEILKKGVKAFRHLHEIMEEFGVTKYRAVATSASREAQNRDTLIRRVKQATGIALEVISAKEESRLGREAVFAALGPEAHAGCIVDLGGGSLELSILRDHALTHAAQLPLGTVRLMSTLNLPGVIGPVQAEQVRRYVRALLESRLPVPSQSCRSRSRGSRWKCGNPGRMLPPARARTACQPSKSLCFANACRTSSKRDVRSRMKAYGVRRDRADVMAVAALIFVTLGRYLNIRTFAIPSVGLREGLLQEIARDAFSRKEPHRYNAEARQILVATRSFRPPPGLRPAPRRTCSRTQPHALRPASAAAPSAAFKLVSSSKPAPFFTT